MDQEENATNKTIPVPFHGNTLYLVERDGEPFAPMKPIVEGMGMAWQVQHRKLDSNKERWGITIMVIPSKSGDQETLCMPLRKLPGWLMTIHPTRVKPEIREKILRYQNECDDVLWNYWTQGAAINPRVPERELKEVVRQALSEYSRAQMSASPAVDRELERDRFRLEMMKFQSEKATKLKEMAFDLQGRGLFDLRYVRRVAEHAVGLLTGETISPKVSVDLSSWLRSRGISPSDGNAAAFGRIAAQVHRTMRGTEPKKRPMILSGREVLVNYYEDPEDLPVLDEALTRFRGSRKQGSLLPLFGGNLS